MKKRFIKAAAAVIFLISISLQVYAMPPHPGNTKPSGRERPAPVSEAGETLYRSLLRSSSAMRTSGIAAAGNVRVLVILADFGSDIAVMPPALPKDNTIFPYIPALYAFFIAFLTGFLFFSGRSRKAWLFATASSLAIFAGCPSSGGSSTDYGDPLYFRTDNSVFESILGGAGSMTMKQYYLDMSDSNMTLSFDVVGPYRAPYGWQYYGRNDSSGFDMYAGEFVGEAVDLAQASGVDFSQYDNDGNGYVDTVIVVHAGQGEEFAGGDDAIWSHNWKLSSAAAYGDGSGRRYYDGVYVDNYTIQPEYNLNPGDATIGVFCHEFGHVLGLPDLYDTSGATNGVGLWSLMGSGSWGSGEGEDPAPLLAWERYLTGGEGAAKWATITPLTVDVTGQNIQDIETDKTAFKISLENSQYLLLEGKTQEKTGNGWYVPASGMLITHINNNVLLESNYLNNNVNAGFARVHGVTIVEAATIHDASGRGLLWTKDTLTSTDYNNMPFASSTKNSLAYSNDNPQLITSHPNNNSFTATEITTTAKTGVLAITVSAISSSASFPMTFNLDMP